MTNFSQEISALKNKLENNYGILLPTETVYGLLGNAYSDQAKKNIFDIKKRPKEKTFTIFIDKSKISEYVELNQRNKILVEKFMPGPVTFILKNIDKKLNHLTINEKIAIRIPDNLFLLELLKNLDFPLIATSANISGENAPVYYSEINNEVKNHPLVHSYNYENYVDKAPSGLASSIFDISEKEIKIIREGEITLADLNNTLSKSSNMV